MVAMQSTCKTNLSFFLHFSFICYHTITIIIIIIIIIIVICSRISLTMRTFIYKYRLAFANSLALIPDGVPSVLAAPLMCAGVTTYNALRNSGARAGDLVAIQGMGGLGHLGYDCYVRVHTFGGGQ